MCSARWKQAISAEKNSRRVAVLRAAETRRLSILNIGVNTFRAPHSEAAPAAIELARSTDAEKQSQLKRLKDFHERNAAAGARVLERLRRTVIENGNTFDVLMEAVRHCSLGEITHTLYDVGGRYRRNM